MATYSNNTTIKFLQGTTLVGNQSFTVPASCYAIIGFIDSSSTGIIPGFGGGGSSSVKLDGYTLASSTDGIDSGDQGPVNVYVPEGKVITTQISGKATAYALISVFKNSP